MSNQTKSTTDRAAVIKSLKHYPLEKSHRTAKGYEARLPSLVKGGLGGIFQPAAATTDLGNLYREPHHPCKSIPEAF